VSSADNLDELAADPKRPQAAPARPPTDLRGRIRVRLGAEDGSLVAYGFGGQRVVIPAFAVGAVRTVDGYRLGSLDRGRALLVFDHQERLLLRARGRWETYGDVAAVCRAAGAPAPTHVRYFSRRRKAGRGRRERQRRPPLYQRAPGCRKLRTAPRGHTPRVLARDAVFFAVVGAAAFVGVIPGAVLPDWFGAVRVLLGLVGAVLGAAAGSWLFAALSHLVNDGLRWAVASCSARSLAPAGRFFRRRPRSGAWSAWATAGMVALVPALIAWGPGVGIASLAHGLSDSSLVAQLRAHGVSTPGFLVDVPQYSTDDNGQATVTDVATLTFVPNHEKKPWETTDPAVGGRPLPLNQADPGDTKERMTVVYLPADPDTAAARQQIAGSVWHGAPTANVIVGSLLTLALPLLIWRLVYRIRRQRWLRYAALFDETGVDHE